MCPKEEVGGWPMDFGNIDRDMCGSCRLSRERLLATEEALGFEA